MIAPKQKGSGCKELLGPNLPANKDNLIYDFLGPKLPRPHLKLFIYSAKYS